MSQKVAVVDAGTWGTALASLLARGGHEVGLHCYSAEIAAGIQLNRRNPQFLPDVELPSGIHATAHLPEALAGSQIAYLVVPTRYLRSFMTHQIDAWRAWTEQGTVLCNCTKGLLLDPTERTDEWLARVLPEVALCHLAGPNFAKELVRGKPAAAVVAGPAWAAGQVQAQLMSDIFRLYTGTDLVGIEVAGFYKNVIAIAAGALTELEMGNNARASLVTRALAEMGRLVDYFGGDPATLSGLAGVGDLMLTCSSEMSRNFQVGMRLARGQSLAQVLEEMTEVAEGIQASQALHNWPADHKLGDWPELPLAEEVFRFVHEGADPHEVILRLMRRPPKAE